SDVGSIVGFVKDPSGGVIPNASVTVQNEATHEEHKAQTDAQGHYTVPNLPPGYYSVTASSSGFKKFESTQNKLDANTTLNIDANLAVGQTSETVEVTSSATPLQTESGAMQQNVTSQQIQAQELNGRNPLYMASLLPGVRTNSTTGDFSFSLTNGGYNINGARQQDSLIT